MLSNRVVFLRAVFLSVLIGTGLPSAFAGTPQAETLPVTTSSPEARQVFEQGLARFENDLRGETTVNIWEQAIAKDPNFALAHGFIAFVSRDPIDQATHRKAALELSKNATKGE